MTAKEMFEELDYVEFNGNYQKTNGLTQFTIEFDKDKKEINFSLCKYEHSTFTDDFELVLDNPILSLKEFKAIQKQLEELNWIE